MKALRMMLFLFLFAAGLVLAVSASAADHVIQTPLEAKWGPAPPMLPAGAQISVMSGDPMGNSAFAIRLKLPAHYKVPAHSHPTDENVVVVSGKLSLGMGDKLDMKTAKTLGIGGYAFMPANMNHFAFTTVPTVIVLSGQGPVEFKYVNPADDPRNAPAKK